MSSLAMFHNELILQIQDRRKEVDSFNLRNLPYNCIGRIGVDNEQLGAIQCGTGFLISSSLILTSAHNLEALSEKPTPHDCQKIVFNIYDYVNGAAVKIKYTIESYRMCSQYRPTENALVALQLQYNQESDKAKKLLIRKRAEEIYMNGAKYDYALLKLNRNIERHKYFKLYQNLVTSPQLTVCGFNDQNTLKFHSNPPAFVDNGIICYDIDTIGGQSGSPVYDQKVSSNLVAIHKGFVTSKRLNIAVMITSELINVLEKWAVEMGVIFDVINPIAVNTQTEESQIKIMQLTSKLEQSFNEKENLENTLYENKYFLSNFSRKLEKQNNRIKQVQNQLRDYEKRQADYKKTIEQLKYQIYELKIINQSKSTSPLIKKLDNKAISPTVKAQKIQLSPFKMPKGQLQLKSIQIVAQKYQIMSIKLKQTLQKSKVTTLALKCTVLIQVQSKYKLIKTVYLLPQFSCTN